MYIITRSRRWISSSDKDILCNISSFARLYYLGNSVRSRKEPKPDQL
jgi:hypothetical protein